MPSHKGCGPGSGLKVCHLGYGGMGRFIPAGFGGVGAGVRQAKAEQIKDVHLWAFAWANFFLSSFWRSGADMGVSWAGRRLLLLGSRSVTQILLSGCLPKAGHDVLDSKAVV